MADAAPARVVLPEILRFLGTAEGFALLPVEVPGPDVARALADWLAEQGHPLDVVEPTDDAAWRGLTARLVAARPGAYGGVMVVGPAASSPALREGLFLLNQRRDVVIRSLAAPLVWCGPADFLRETWRAAPDFWSVRALTWRVAPRDARPEAAMPFSGPLVADDPDHLAALRDEARRQGDRLNAARIGYLLAGAWASRSQPAAARAAVAAALADLPPGDDDLAFDLAILDARLAMLTRERGAVTRRLAEARRLAGASPGKRAQVDLVVARRLVASGKTAQAEKLFGEVAARCRDERPFLAARALTSRGRLLRRGASRAPERLDAAEQALREALALFQALGEPLGAANVLAELGELARQRGRSAEAVALYRGAFDTWREHGAVEAARRVRRKLRLARRSVRGGSGPA